MVLKVIYVSSYRCDGSSLVSRVVVFAVTTNMYTHSTYTTCSDSKIYSNKNAYSFSCTRLFFLAPSPVILLIKNRALIQLQPQPQWIVFCRRSAATNDRPRYPSNCGPNDEASYFVRPGITVVQFFCLTTESFRAVSPI